MYCSDVTIFIPKISSMFSTNPELSESLITSLVTMSFWPQCSDYLNKIFGDYFRSLLNYPNYHNYAQTFLNNYNKAHQSIERQHSAPILLEEIGIKTKSNSLVNLFDASKQQSESGCTTSSYYFESSTDVNNVKQTSFTSEDHVPPSLYESESSTPDSEASSNTESSSSSSYSSSLSF